MARTITLVGVCLIVLGAVTMAGPAFGFSSLAADRGVYVGTATDPNGLLGVNDNSDTADANIKNSNDQSLLYYLDDNTGAFSSTNAISANVTAFDGSSTALEATVQSADGVNDFIVVMTCGQSNLNTQGYPTVEITANDTDLRVELERTTVNPIDVNCRGGGNGGGGGNNPGAGFTELRVDNVDAYTSPGDDRQTFAFTPSSDLNPGNGLVRIDLNEPHPSAVDYEAEPTYYPDVVLEQGSGSVSYDTDTKELVYDPGSHDDAGSEIIVSVGDYAAYGPSGPHEVTFTRTRTGAEGTADFDVVDTGNTAIESVEVSDVDPNSQPSDGETQAIAFTFGIEPSGSDRLTVDLSNPQGNGVDYTEINWDNREVVVEQGDGEAWYQSDDDAIQYQAADSDGENDRIILQIEGFSTEDSGGPYEVPIYWERPDIQEEGTFKIQ